MEYKAEVLNRSGEREQVSLSWDSCVAAGYTGRDQESVRAHVEELVKLGVTAPSSIPSMYWVDPTRISDAARVTVIGEETSGEIEFFLALDEAGDACFTVASDHTDRKLETVSVSKAKAICEKIVGTEFWRLSDVCDHWDELELACHVLIGAGEDWVLYQKGTLGMMLDPEDLLERARRDCPSPGERVCLFSGTVPVIGGELVYGQAYRLELKDPVLGRTLTHEYEVRILPDRN